MRPLVVGVTETMLPWAVTRQDGAVILVAVDAGGTRTRASVVDHSLACVGTGRAGRGNPVASGPEAAFDQIVAAISQAAGVAQIALPEIGSITLAGAGATAFHPDFISQRLAEVDVLAPLSVRGDLAALFCSGTHETAGYSLVAGTGATAARIVDSTEVQVSDGLGWLLGDTGSGFWIGRRVARAVAAALDGRAPTSMVEAALAVFGIEPDAAPARGGVEPGPAPARGRSHTSQQLIHAVYGGSPLALAALAPVAFLDERDGVSAQIVREAADGLAQAVMDVHDDDVTGPLVVGGGVMSGQPRLREATLAALEDAGLGADGPELRVVEAVDGLVGASVLGLRDAGVVVDAAVFARLTMTTGEQQNSGPAAVHQSGGP